MPEPTPLEALAAIVNRPSYKKIAAELQALRADFIDHRHVFVHVDALAGIMPRLQTVVEKVKQADAEA